MKPTHIAAIAALALGLAAPAARAHHSFSAEFDVNKPIKLQGTVKRVQWINPHTWIWIDVKKPDGTIEEWGVEAGTPNTLFRLGFTREALPVGTEIVVSGYEARDGAKRANGRPPGRADTAARERTTAAYAIVGEPIAWNVPTAHVRMVGSGAATLGACSARCPPHPASRSRSVKVVKVLCRTADNKLERPNVLLP